MQVTFPHMFTLYRLNKTILRIFTEVFFKQ